MVPPRKAFVTTDHPSTSTTNTGVSAQHDPCGTVVVQLAGELLSEAATNLTHLINDELLRRPQHTVIDVSEVTVIDAPGANALLLATGMDVEHDVPLFLSWCTKRRPVDTVLHNLDLLDLFEVR